MIPLRTQFRKWGYFSFINPSQNFLCSPCNIAYPWQQSIVSCCSNGSWSCCYYSAGNIQQLSVMLKAYENWQAVFFECHRTDHWVPLRMPVPAKGSKQTGSSCVIRKEQFMYCWNRTEEERGKWYAQCVRTIAC